MGEVRCVDDQRSSQLPLGSIDKDADKPGTWSPSRDSHIRRKAFFARSVWRCRSRGRLSENSIVPYGSASPSLSVDRVGNFNLRSASASSFHHLVYGSVEGVSGTIAALVLRFGL